MPDYVRVVAHTGKTKKNVRKLALHHRPLAQAIASARYRGIRLPREAGKDRSHASDMRATRTVLRNSRTNSLVQEETVQPAEIGCLSAKHFGPITFGHKLRLKLSQFDEYVS
jgi:hypothetical protein